MFFGIFVLNRVSFLRQEPITLFLDDKQPALMFYECLKLGIKNRNSVLNRVGKSTIFVLTAYEGPSRTSPPKDISSIPPGLLTTCLLAWLMNRWNTFMGANVTLFVKIPSTIRTAGHLVGEKPCPWVNHNTQNREWFRLTYGYKTLLISHYLSILNKDRICSGRFLKKL